MLLCNQRGKAGQIVGCIAFILKFNVLKVSWCLLENVVHLNFTNK